MQTYTELTFCCPAPLCLATSYEVERSLQSGFTTLKICIASLAAPPPPLNLWCVNHLQCFFFIQEIQGALVIFLNYVLQFWIVDS